MNSVENKNQIVDINGYVHVINGKVICFEPDVYDLNNPEDVKYLCDWTKDMWNDEYLRKKYNDDTLAYVEKSSDGTQNIVSTGSITVYFKSVSEDVSKKVKAAIEEYHSLQDLYKNNQIVDIGENVYVINKKPVYIYPSALDLHKAADVDEICRLVCDTGDDMAERLTRFGKDTMLVLGTEHEEGHYNISSGDIATLPEDIQKKVRLFTK